MFYIPLLLPIPGIISSDYSRVANIMRGHFSFCHKDENMKQGVPATQPTTGTKKGGSTEPLSTNMLNGSVLPPLRDWTPAFS